MYNTKFILALISCGLINAKSMNWSLKASIGYNGSLRGINTNTQTDLKGDLRQLEPLLKSNSRAVRDGNIPGIDGQLTAKWGRALIDGDKFGATLQLIRILEAINALSGDKKDVANRAFDTLEKLANFDDMLRRAMSYDGPSRCLESSVDQSEQKSGVEFAGAVYAIDQINDFFGMGFELEVGYSMHHTRYLQYQITEGLFARVGAAFTMTEWFMLNVGVKVGNLGLKHNNESASALSIGLFADANLLIPLTDNIKAVVTLGVSGDVSAPEFKMKDRDYIELLKAATPDQKTQELLANPSLSDIRQTTSITVRNRLNLRFTVGVLYTF